MKQNLSQIQYEQLAREHFRNRHNEIPFVSDIEVLLEKKNAPLGISRQGGVFGGQQ